MSGPFLAALIVASVAVCCLMPALAVAAPSAPPRRGAAGEQQKCTYKPVPPRGVTLKPTVKLTPDVATQIVNFGGRRGWQFVDVVLNATPALPANLLPSDVHLEVLRRFTRVSPTLPTRYAPPPTFTPPAFSSGRDRITFTVCLNSTGMVPGAYGGSVLVEGPAGLGPASLSITENLKDANLALWLAIASLVAAFLFLLLRGAAARQAKAAERHGQAMAKTAGKSDDVRQAALADAPEPKIHIHGYFVDVLADLNWWLTTLVSLGVAAGSIIALYSANPAWGADFWASLAAIVSPTFAAVGVQSVITSLGKSVSA